MPHLLSLSCIMFIHNFYTVYIYHSCWLQSHDKCKWRWGSCCHFAWFVWIISLSKCVICQPSPIFLLHAFDTCLWYYLQARMVSSQLLFSTSKSGSELHPYINWDFPPIFMFPAKKLAAFFRDTNIVIINNTKKTTRLLFHIQSQTNNKLLQHRLCIYTVGYVWKDHHSCCWRSSLNEQFPLHKRTLFPFSPIGHITGLM